MQLIPEKRARPCFACSSIVVVAEDKSVVVGRTMDFPIDVLFNIVLYPAKMQISSQLANNKQGMRWQTKYAFFGVDAAMDSSTAGYLQEISDGVNEMGLSVEAQWLPDTDYGVIHEHHQAMHVVDFMGWLLGNFASVEEVKQALTNQAIQLESPYLVELDENIPLHFGVADKTGTRIAIEFLNGKVQVVPNPVKVLTNAPSLEWQLTNLRYYTGVNPYTPEPLIINDVEFMPTGNGGCMIGLPGDFSSPSRFVRLALLGHYVRPAKDSRKAEALVGKLMNSVDVPKGAVLIKTPHMIEEDYTIWTVIKNLTDNRWMIRAYDNLNYQTVDLNAVWEKAKSIDRPLRLPLKSISEQAVLDITDEVCKL